MQNTFGLNRSLGSAIGAIALVSLISAAAVLTTVGQLRTATEQRLHSTRIIRAADAFLAAMLNQETGLRGYLITGRESSLEPYRAARPALDHAIADLHGLLRKNAMQASRLAAAETAARAWQTSIGETILRDMADPATRQDAVRIESAGGGKLYFDAFREKLGAMQADEDAALAVQDRFLASAERAAGIATWVGSILTVLICIGIGIAINRLVVRPLTALAAAMGQLATRNLDVTVPGTGQRNEIGAMARTVEVFKTGLIELDRTSLLRATADTLPAMVGYVDAQRRVGFLNGEFGRWFDLGTDDVAEIHGRPLAQVFAREAFPGVGRELEAAFAGTEGRFEHRLARRGTGVRELEGFYRPHRAADGAVLGVVTLLTDITERKRMEARLARQARDLLNTNEELEQFAYVASHDLKAPLRGIENLVSWIEEDLDQALTGDTRTNMELLKSRVRRLESLLDDLLAYSRAGRGEADIDIVDTRLLVDELAALISPPAGFRIEPGGDLPTIRTARAPLTQVLQNLIGNAVKHHDRPAEGLVRVDAVERADIVEFTVTDDGPGIPGQFHARVFGMFQTLKPRDEIEGSGMGLAIVKKLVERHGGSIWLDASRQGRGLAVHFTWSIGTEKGHPDGASRQSAAGR